MTDPVEIAVIGAAHPHVDYVLDEAGRRRDIRIVAVCDPDPERRAMLERRTGAPGYGDPANLLDRHAVRAASVVTEFGSRAGIVAELLRRGIFAIVDKPLAVTEAQLAEVETALAGRDLLALLLEKRFYPVTLALRDILGAGELGEVVTITSTGPHKLRPAGRPAWMFDPARYGGILADLTVHDIDLALSLTGATGGTGAGWISPVPAEGTTAFPAAGRAVLTCDDGPQITIDVDWIQPDASPRHGDYAMRISGTKGRADMLFAQNRLVIETAIRTRREIVLPQGQPPARFAFDHLTRDDPLAITPGDALRATRIAILAQGSAAQRGSGFRWS